MTATRTAVVTGVARAGQVGEAIARRLVDDGWQVACLDRDAEAVAARVADLGPRAVAIPCDLTDLPAVEVAAARVAATFGAPLHGLVCAAGGFGMSGPVATADVTVLHRQVAISLTTAYVTSRAFLGALRAGAGAAVYFASAAVLPGGRVAGMSAYAAAKAGVVALMQAVAQEEAPHGVRANAVAPTLVRTAANEAAMGTDAAYVEREAVADTVAWLLAPATPVNGQVLRLG
jgi:NAD(P)-dependent dehydrogenase (short-subunit alcohol dehydrogenase family)